MRIAFVGDIHGDINGMYKYLWELEQRLDAPIDLVVHVGDFGIYLPPETPTNKELYGGDAIFTFAPYWEGRKTAPWPTLICPGNHESHPVIEAWKNAPNKVKNMHLMPDGGVTEVLFSDGSELSLTIGAVWGNYSYKSYVNPERIHTARRNHPFSPKANHIEAASVKRLLREGGKLDILITHDCPQAMAPTYGQPPQFIKDQLGIDKDEPCAGCPGFNEILATNQPVLHYFGHFHTRKVVNRPEDGTMYDGKPITTHVECLHCFNYNKEQSVVVQDVTKDEDGTLHVADVRIPVRLED